MCVYNIRIYNYVSGIWFLGFGELIPNQLLRPFDERELELVIGGISSIDVNDWKTHTRLKHCTQDTSQVQWFWQVIVFCSLLTLCVPSPPLINLPIEHNRLWRAIHRRCGHVSFSSSPDRLGFPCKDSGRCRAQREPSVHDCSPFI